MASRKPTEGSELPEPYPLVALIASYMVRVPGEYRKAAAWALTGLAALLLAVGFAIASTLVGMGGSSFLEVFLALVALGLGIISGVTFTFSLVELEEALSDDS